MRDFENHPVIFDLALVFYQIELPRFRGLGDFPPVFAPFQEGRADVERYQRSDQVEKPWP